MRSYQPKSKKSRRAVAILLSLVLILSCSGITALAAEVPEAAADRVSEEKPDASSNASDQGELSDEDVSYEDPADEAGSNEEKVPSEQSPEEAAGEGLNKGEADETPSWNSPEQEGSNGKEAATPSENSPEQDGTDGETTETASDITPEQTSPEQERTEGQDPEQQASDEYSDEYIEEVPGEEGSEEAALGEVITATGDDDLSEWRKLRNMLIAGGVITLDKSYMNNGGAEVPLEIPANKDVTLDLNGCNIDRGLAEFDAHTYGYVIINNGTLTIKDTSNDHDGKITGANNSEHGGGIINNGTLILEGGSIDGNTADLRGGAIYNAKSGSVTMTGGIISNNTAISYDGGGIYNAGTLTLSGGRIESNKANGKYARGNGGGILQDGTMNVSGNPIVKDNIAKKGNNVYLRKESPIMNIVDEFTQGAYLGVCSEVNGIFTSGYGTHNNESPDTYFFSEGGYHILPVNNEAKLTNNRTTFIERSWNGSEVVDTLKEMYDVPVLTADTGMTGGWYYLNSNVMIDERVSLTGDTNLILGDGYTLDVKGLYVPASCTLTIYAQSDGEGAGKIISNAKVSTDAGAGIGGSIDQDNGKIVIHGGNITAIGGHDGSASIGGNGLRRPGLRETGQPRRVNTYPLSPVTGITFMTPSY